MKLLEVFSKDAVPDCYRFVFDDVNELGLYAVLSMTENGTQGAWVREQYEPGGSNQHLGSPIALGSLGEVALNGFFSWLGVVTEYGSEG